MKEAELFICCIPCKIYEN